MAAIPFNRRGTLRSLSHAIQIPKSTLHRHLKQGTTIKRISSTIKPLLTEENCHSRLRFSLSMLKPNGFFIDMYDYVHIDEKWFYLTKAKRSYYTLLNEKPPERSCKSKRYIMKVMFMAAVARPRYDYGRQQNFNGKIGIWPFVYKEPSKRNSKNRPKGTMITKNIESINLNEFRSMVYNNILPASRSIVPITNKTRPLFIQQDNARPHTRDDDPEMTAEGLKDGWNIKLQSQPANSPDFNVLDLGFFNAIQSLHHEGRRNLLRI